jgi:hypothetical protein
MKSNVVAKQQQRVLPLLLPPMWNVVVNYRKIFVNVLLSSAEILKEVLIWQPLPPMDKTFIAPLSKLQPIKRLLN